VHIFRFLFDRGRAFFAVATMTIVVSVLVSACSDDPVLGPSDGEPDGGGSYSVIEKLAQPDTAAPTSTDTSAASKNPERF